MLTELTVREYAKRLAAGEPVPGGGSGAALVGALAAALGEMAGNFTIGREKFAAVEQEVQSILSVLERQRRRLLELTDADAEAYERVGAAYKLPKSTENEQAARRAAIQEALTAAADVPLAVMEACVNILAQLEQLRQVANPNLLSDVGVSAELSFAALRCAWLNVEVNLAGIKDEAYVSGTRQRIDRQVQACETPARMVFDRIARDIRGASGG